jgi:hypothetical protein
MREPGRPFPWTRAALRLALAAALACGGLPVRADPGGGGHGGGPGPPVSLPPVSGVHGGGGGGGSGHGGPGPGGAGSGGPGAAAGAPVLGGVVSPFPAPNPGRGRGRGDDGSGRGGPGPSLGDGLRGGDHHGREDADEVRDLVRAATHGKGGGEAQDLLEKGETVAAAAAATAALEQARQSQASALIRNHPDLVEPDNLGRPVVRHEVLAIAPSPAVLAAAARAGFRVRSTETLGDLGLTNVVLQAPRGLSAVEALRRLRALDPRGEFDFNHLYQEGGRIAGKATLAAAPAAAARPRLPAHGVRVGLVDGGVAAGQPALAGAAIVQKGFAPGGPKPSAHGTAVASLIAGRKGVFRGAAPGAALLVADVYGATPAGGSAEAIARALAWLSQMHAPVINISLVGPPNLLLEAAVKALIARGHIVVAAVGNDGPAAPPLYPASYPGVVAVTGVDANWRLLPEAGHASHIDFAAPGAEMAAAGADGGFVAVRGTSFAAPLAAGLLAKLIQAPDQKEAERALDVLGRRAMDLGPRGRDARYGRGVVAVEFRTPPGEVRATRSLRGP